MLCHTFRLNGDIHNHQHRHHHYYHHNHHLRSRPLQHWEGRCRWGWRRMVSSGRTQDDAAAAVAAVLEFSICPGVITERLEPQEHVSGWVASISGQALRLKVVAHSKSQQHSSLAPRLLPTLPQTQSAFSPYCVDCHHHHHHHHHAERCMLLLLLGQRRNLSNMTAVPLAHLGVAAPVDG